MRKCKMLPINLYKIAVLMGFEYSFWCGNLSLYHHYILILGGSSNSFGNSFSAMESCKLYAFLISFPKSFNANNNSLTFFPLQAIDGTYIDKKCPFTGNVSIRGRILIGIVRKMKMQRTIVIRRDYLHYIKKYNRFEKRHRNMSVHLSPAFR